MFPDTANTVLTAPSPLLLLLLVPLPGSGLLGGGGLGLGLPLGLLRLRVLTMGRLGAACATDGCFCRRAAWEGVRRAAKPLLTTL